MLRDAIDREATRLALETGSTGTDTTRPPASQDRGWIQRHPALVGALAGAGLGAVSSIPRWTELYCAGGGDEDCLFYGGRGVLFGAGAGAGVGALIGPYEASAATLVDGRVVSMLDEAGNFLPGIQDVLAEWGPEDETMAAVTRTTDQAEQIRLLRGYLGGLHRTGLALRRWVDDTKLVLDRLSTVPARSAAGQLAARLDISRLGVFGHSMGGVTAGQFCVEDRRCKAGLNLDGSPQSGTMIDKSMSRPFLMVYSARPGRSGASDAIYRRAAHPYYRVVVRDTKHLDFSDMPFWGGPLRDRPVLGTIAPARVTEITGVIVRQYFGQELLGQHSKLLEGTPLFPEVTVRTFSPPAR